MTHLVLVGGGHANLFVLQRLLKEKHKPQQVTLISPSRWQYYSGMLPGWMAGHYELQDCRIDLQSLAQRAAVRFIESSINGIDAGSRRLQLADRSELVYDLLALNTGSETNISALRQAGDMVLPIKPLSNFIARWPVLKAEALASKNSHLLIAGGGAGGVELALAAHHALRQKTGRSADSLQITLVAGEKGLLPDHAEGVRKRIHTVLKKAQIQIVVDNITANHTGFVTESGRDCAANYLIAVTGATAPSWLPASGLQLDASGFISVDAYHRSLTHEQVFAAGDICSRSDVVVARSGVHAVRAGPVLADNLLAVWQGEELRTYKPRRHVLYLMSTGDRNAVASWGRWSAQGVWVWRWKNKIDRGFIMRFAPPAQAAIMSYGHWPSALSAENVFAGSEQVTYVRPCRNGVFFVLNIPEEGNIQALMHLTTDGTQRRISPVGFNVRSRVHEYGGMPYAFTDDTVFFCNFRDQRVMKLSYDTNTCTAGSCEILTPLKSIPDDQLRYVDFIVDSMRRRLICVREDHRNADAEPVNALIAIDIDSGGEEVVLFAGTDFVAAPALSADSSMLAFQTWSHPNMPWDSTQIQIADIDGDGKLKNLRQVAQKAPGSLVQPAFGPAGDLYFIADWSDWWNLYRVSADNLQGNCEPQIVYAMSAEFCPALWQLGQRNYDFVDTQRLVVSLTRNALWELALLEPGCGTLTILQAELGMLDNVLCRDGKVFYTAAASDTASSIMAMDLCKDTGEPARALYTCKRSDGLPATDMSRPQHISFASQEGTQSHALFYPPHNPAYIAPEQSLPPLLVLVHGGPTGTARAAFNPALQFWTSRGFAVLDINHRGSTGYGRKFRHSLYGQWGVADVVDVGSAVQYLIDTGKVDDSRIAIRGGSAGGYVVLATLVNSKLFRVGCSYYGVSDLELLAADTHKFEARYLDQLVGPYPQAKALYQERSPIHHIEAIDAAVLLLQGMEDKVVPPNQAEAIYQKLLQKNPATRYVCFADEGHGFRKPVNQVAALQAELAFYQANLL